MAAPICVSSRFGVGGRVGAKPQPPAFAGADCPVSKPGRPGAGSLLAGQALVGAGLGGVGGQGRRQAEPLLVSLPASCWKTGPARWGGASQAGPAEGRDFCLVRWL